MNIKQKSTIEVMQLGVAFAEKHKTESEPYNSGIGYGYACGYEAAMEELAQSLPSMRWVKCEDRLPEGTRGYGKQLAVRWEFADGPQMRVMTVNQLLDTCKMMIDLNKIEWMDESPSKMNSDLSRAAGLLDGGISAWKTIDKVKPEGMVDIMIEVRGLIEKYLNK